MTKEAKRQRGVWEILRQYGVLTPSDEADLSATEEEARGLVKGLLGRAGQLIRNSSSLVVRKFPVIDLDRTKAQEAALKIFTKDESFAHLLFAFKVEGDEVSVAVADDSNLLIAFQRALVLGKTFKYFSATGKDLRAAIKNCYQIEDRDEGAEQKLDRAGLEWLMQNILNHADAVGAKEVHFIPTARLMNVEFRTEQGPVVGEPMPKRFARSIIAGYKQIGGFGPKKKASMQNGTFERVIGQRTYRVVLVTGPSEYGEVATLFLTPLDSAP